MITRGKLILGGMKHKARREKGEIPEGAMCNFAPFRDRSFTLSNFLIEVLIPILEYSTFLHKPEYGMALL